MKIFKVLACIAMVMYAFSFSSCVKDEVDNPPDYGTEPALTVNKTIAALKAFYTGTTMKIDSDWVIKGVVVGDDHSGNFYKSIVIEDATGGINIQIDQSDYYSSYKVGRNVYVKCKGLVIGDYNGLVQLGGYIDATNGVGRIPQSLVPQYLIGGMWNQSTAAKTVTNFDSLDLVIDQNKLVRLDNVHFDQAEICQPWADLIGQTSGNRDLLDAFGNVIIVRTSNFATFATSKIPAGTGSIVGVFQIYNNDKQFVLRDLNDVIMDPPVCITFGPVHTMIELSTIFSQGASSVPSGSSITGIVISDRSNGSITANNLVVQDTTGGITVRFTVANTFNLGDKITINISDQELSEYNSLLQVNNVPIGRAVLVNTGNSITPRLATIAEVNTNAEAWESTLIKIVGVTITGAGTYSGTTILSDVTGTLPMFTRSSASFSGTPYPGTAVEITGIVSDFNATQLNIRNLTDVVQ